MLVKRERILAAALTVFYETGYDLSTMEMVAERAGMARRTIYGYFNSRDEMFIATHHDGIKKQLKLLPWDVSAGISGREHLELLARSYLDFYRQYPGYLKMYFFLLYKLDNQRGDTGAHFELIDDQQILLGKFRQIIESGKSDGSINRSINTGYMIFNYCTLIHSIINYVLAGYKDQEYYANSISEFLMQSKA